MKHGHTFSGQRCSPAFPFSDLSESKVRPAVVLALYIDEFTCQ